METKEEGTPGLFPGTISEIFDELIEKDENYPNWRYPPLVDIGHIILTINIPNRLSELILKGTTNTLERKKILGEIITLVDPKEEYVHFVVNLFQQDPSSNKELIKTYIFEDWYHQKHSKEAMNK